MPLYITNPLVQAVIELSQHPLGFLTLRSTQLPASNHYHCTSDKVVETVIYKNKAN